MCLMRLLLRSGELLRFKVSSSVGGDREVRADNVKELSELREAASAGD